MASRRRTVLPIVTDVTLSPWRARALCGLATLLVVAGLALVPAAQRAHAAQLGHAAGTAARDDIYPVPPGGVYTFDGRGFGHGHGMSQWGAYGAAKVDHLSANEILQFYYSHTTLATRSTARTIRVLLTAADAPDRGYLQVDPAAGLAVTVGGGKPKVLPAKTAAAQPITGWRLRRSDAVVRLRDLAAGKWHKFRAVGTGATFTDTASEIPVVESGRVATYRGSMVGELESGALEAVNVVNLELYLRAVVPAEMSSSWSAAALQAQAVAARTYARRGLNNPKASWYDVDGDPRDQAYGGVGVEAKRSTEAVEATAGEIIVDSSKRAILAQYASADGGWTVSGGEPYLPAKRDPYDGAVPNSSHAWTTSISAGSIAAAYPQLGALKDIEITGRDGDGLWGGRVTALTLRGSRTSVALTGSDLQFALGLRSPWFRPVPTPAAPSALAASPAGKAVTATWKRPVPVRGAARVTGYRFTLSPGKHHQTLAASVLTASVRRLPAGTYTVTVVALSQAGAGPAATVVVKTVDK
jgi:stage II sporulation protein D